MPVTYRITQESLIRVKFGQHLRKTEEEEKAHKKSHQRVVTKIKKEEK